MMGEIELGAAPLQLYSSGTHEWLGQSISACDLDGDGRPELVAGAPGHNGGEESGGVVYILDLPSTGLRGVHEGAHQILGTQAQAQLGGNSACQPAHEGGAGWLAAAASNATTTTTQTGLVLLFGAGGGGLSDDTSATARIEGDSTGQHLGTALSIGDINGDGSPDLLLGGGGEGVGADRASVAAIILGPITGTMTVADADRRYGEASPMDRMGNTASTGEDMNDDGYADLAIAAYWDSTTDERSGAVYILSGGPSGPPPFSDTAAIIRGVHAYSYAGISVDWLEDADGDGRADLAVGEYGRGSGGDPEADRVGAAHLFTQTLAGVILTSDADLTFEGSEHNAAFGYALAGVVDADLDGRSDLMVGAYQVGGSSGEVLLFSGGDAR